MKIRNVIAIIGAVAVAAVILKLNVAVPSLSARALDPRVKAMPATRPEVNPAILVPDQSTGPRGDEAIPKSAVAGGCCGAAKMSETPAPACCAKP